MYMESGKMVLMKLFAGQQQRRRHREETDRRSRVGWGGKEGGVRCMERVTWKLTYRMENRQPWEFAVWLRELTRALWQPRGVGWAGRWEEAEEGPMADSFGVWQKPTKFCKAIIFQLKNKLKKNRPKKTQNLFSFFLSF